MAATAAESIEPTGTSPRPTDRRPTFLLRPRWLVFHVIVLAAIVLMVNLGFWQLRRLDERQTFNAAVIERSEQAALALDDVVQRIDSGALPLDEAEWLPVSVTGTFLPDQIVEFNQSQGGAAGENVLTPLAVDDGTTVVVNRGFIRLGSSVPPAPNGEIEVLGLVRLSEERGRGGLTDPVPVDGPLTEVRRIDLDLINPTLPGDTVPVYVQLVTSDPVPPGDAPAPVVRPELDDGPHLSYAIQWFIFAVCVAIGWVLAVRRSLRSRATPPAAPSGDADAREPVGTSPASSS